MKVLKHNKILMLTMAVFYVCFAILMKVVVVDGKFTLIDSGNKQQIMITLDK